MTEVKNPEPNQALLYEELVEDIARFLEPCVGKTAEFARFDNGFLNAVTSLYRGRGGEVDSVGSPWSLSGKPYDEKLWNEARDDEFRRLMRRVLFLILKNYGG